MHVFGNHRMRRGKNIDSRAIFQSLYRCQIPLPRASDICTRRLGSSNDHSLQISSSSSVDKIFYGFEQLEGCFQWLCRQAMEEEKKTAHTRMSLCIMSGENQHVVRTCHPW